MRPRGKELNRMHRKTEDTSPLFLTSDGRNLLGALGAVLAQASELRQWVGEGHRVPGRSCEDVGKCEGHKIQA